MSRREIALKRIDITKGNGLELGPLYSPIVSKEEAKITYVDHMSTEDLKKKYKGHPFSVEDIVETDYVLKNNSLKETLKNKKFNYVIASHVIEHIPDTARWLADVGSVLREGGILSLVIPDKRYTFDILRNESTPGDIIGAYLEGYTRATSATIYDYATKFRDKIVASEVWSNPDKDFSKKPNSLKKAYEACLENLDPDKYVDSHCVVFTPYSFFDIVRHLIEHDLFGYKVAYFEDTPENQLEFYVSLQKDSKSTKAAKIKSLPRIHKPIIRPAVWDEVEMLKAELSNLTSSKSWKLTKPLRAVKSLTNKLKAESRVGSE